MIKKIALSVIGGVIWGWLAMAVNSVSKVFLFEGGLTHNLASFAAAGAVFGAVACGLLCVVEARLPFKSPVLKAVMVTTGVWIVLRVGGAMLSKMEPSRYNIVTPQTLQGFFLAVTLGIILGLLLKNRPLPIQES